MRCFQVQAKLLFWDFNLLLRCAFGVVEILHVVAKPALLPMRFRAPGKNGEMIVVPSDINSPGAFLDFRVVALTKLPHAQE